MDVNQDIIKAEVNRILVEQFELDENALKPNLNLFQDLGLDSLDAIDMVIAFQAKFEVKLKDDDMRSIRTLGDIYSMIERYSDEGLLGRAKPK